MGPAIILPCGNQELCHRPNDEGKSADEDHVIVHGFQHPAVKKRIDGASSPATRTVKTGGLVKVALRIKAMLSGIEGEQEERTGGTSA